MSLEDNTSFIVTIIVGVCVGLGKLVLLKNPIAYRNTTTDCLRNKKRRLEKKLSEIDEEIFKRELNE